MLWSATVTLTPGCEPHALRSVARSNEANGAIRMTGTTLMGKPADGAHGVLSRDVPFERIEYPK